MKLTRHDLIAALRLRYDHHSAQTMFDAARDRAGLADQPTYEPGDAAAWRTALAAIGDRLDNVWIRLDSLAEAPSTKPVVEAKPVVEPKPVAEAVSAPGPAEAVETIETTIGVTGVAVGQGEQVLICGGLGELGDWDPARARLMSRDGDRWLTTLRLPPAAQIAFKFLRRGPDGDVVWEGGENRDLVAKPRIDAVWR